MVPASCFLWFAAVLNGVMNPDMAIFSKHRNKSIDKGVEDCWGWIVQEAERFDFLNMAMSTMFLKQGEHELGWGRFVKHGAAYPFYLMTQLYSEEFLNHLSHLIKSGKGDRLQCGLTIITMEFPEFLVQKMNDRDHAFPQDQAFEDVADELKSHKIWEDDQALADQIANIIKNDDLAKKQGIETKKYVLLFALVIVFVAIIVKASLL